MANRKNTFLLKRSNVVNKTPSLGDIQLGEVALNTADAKLYSSYTGGLTGATEIRQIGWDRLSTISGGTVSGDVTFNDITVNTISATTYLNLPTSTDTFVTGGTYNSGTLTLDRNDGNSVVVTGFTSGGGDNFYVTGFTYNDANTFTISRNGGLGDLTSTINTMTGLTIYGDLYVTGDTTLGPLTATSVTSNSEINVFNGHVNLRDNSYFLQGRTVADVNVSLIGVDNQDRVFVGNAGYDTYINSDTIVDGVLSAQTTFLTTTPTLNNSATDILVRNSSTGEVEYRPVSGITPDTNTFVTGTTFNSNEATLTRNDGVDVFKLSGGTNVTLTNPSTNEIKIDTSDTFVTGYTYNDNNTFTISDNVGSAFTATINQVSGLTTTNFIDYANTSVPSAVSGRTYYDVSENALSYFPETPNMDVTINIGQEGVTRVYNNTGIQINNGQACHLSGEFNGVATVKLAIASGTTDTSDTSYEVTGIATHNIPNGTTGFITNIGLVRDLNITGTTPGSAIFLSDQIPGKLVYELPTTNSSRISQIGYVIATGTTTGRILVELSNESVSVLSTKEIDVLTQNNASTGTRSGGLMTVNGGDNSKFDISAGSGTIMDNFTDGNAPLLTEVVWDTITGVTLTNLTGDVATFLFLDTNGSPVQFALATPPSESDKRDYIYLGIVEHTGPVISNIFNTPIQVVSPINQIEDLTSSIGPFSKNGNRVSNITGTLELQKSSGNSFIYGGNFHTNPKAPSNIQTGVLSGSTLIYAKGTAILGPSGTTVDTVNYDPDGLGTISAIPGSNYVAARIWHSPLNNLLTFQYGQYSYSSQALTRDSFPSENYTPPPGLDIAAYVLAVLIYKKGDGNLDNALVIPQGKFAGTGGGGTSPDTLQSVYDNSIPNPEILTDATNGSVDFRVGSGSDSDNLIRFQ